MGLVFSKQSGAIGYLTMGRQSYDSDAQSFLIAAGITDITQQTATNDLVTDLKGYNIWTKMKAIYPVIGGTATSHKFNLKDPRDLDAAFRITFIGGWTHSSMGIVPNGSNTIADTNLIPTSSLTSGDTHFAIYNRTNATPAIAMGMFTAFGLPDNRWILQDFSTTMYSDHYQYAGNRLTVGISDYRGLWVSSRVSNTHTIYRNGSVSNSQSTTPAGFSALTETVYIQTMNPIGNINLPQYASGVVPFASIGTGLTNTDVSNLYTAVQKFQTTLGRQV